jgi:para-aminobenzoate synthetase component 1
MRSLVQEIQTAHTPESLVTGLRSAAAPGIVLLRTALFESSSARYSLVTASPFLTFRSFGSACEISHRQSAPVTRRQFGNPWHLLEALMARYELLEDIDLPFPLGGGFGYWGYELKNFTEPKLPRRAVNDLELPDCHVGFYDSLTVFDHQLGKTFVVATGLQADGTRSETQASLQLAFWQSLLAQPPHPPASRLVEQTAFPHPKPEPPPAIVSNLSRAEFIAAVERAQRYIRSGDIYQVNLSRRLTVPAPDSSWDLFRNLSTVSPAPFAAYLEAGEISVVSSSPEQFLRLSGSQIVTRPIKGTRPRAHDPTRDAQLANELQTSPKELAELVMITDLLRNDLGRICEYGSVQVPDLARLEKFAQVQHLVSTVEGRLRPGITHFAALASCFPGGSITGAPKFRAMEIIDELEPIARGPYCGAIGYLGFNRESQLSIAIRTAVCAAGNIHFNVGAGIVADSDPAAEYEETQAKARGFLAAFATSHNQAQQAQTLRGDHDPLAMRSLTNHQASAK